VRWGRVALSFQKDIDGGTGKTFVESSSVEIGVALILRTGSAGWCNWNSRNGYFKESTAAKAK
jgi:hypothetical protein